MGYVYVGSWDLSPDTSLGYVINYKGGEGVGRDKVSLDNIWLDFDHCSRLLASKTGEPPPFWSVWTIETDGAVTSYCQAAEFVYRAALKFTSRRSTVFRLRLKKIQILCNFGRRLGFEQSCQVLVVEKCQNLF